MIKVVHFSSTVFFCFEILGIEPRPLCRLNKTVVLFFKESVERDSNRIYQNSKRLFTGDRHIK